MKQLSQNIHKIIQYFKGPEKTSKLAKERLQIIIAHERGSHDQPDYIAALQQDIINVISKYVDIDPSTVKVDLERKDGCSILELNVTLPSFEHA